jgi:putative acetyltransferase
MMIRETTEADLKDILMVERLAFKRDTEANLTRDLLIDPTAKPVLSLLTFIKDQAVGHILFTKATITGAPTITAAFLAPLAVVPGFQKQGIGRSLVNRGLELQTQAGIDFIFLLGHVAYYPRFGFIAASKVGFETTYPIPNEFKDAWMVKALRPNILGKVSGKVLGCNVMNRPENWRQ